MATNRQRIEREKLTTKNYFWYADSRYYPNRFKFKLSEVLCTECDYVPRTDCVNPKRAYRAHLKKYHRAAWERVTGRTYIIEELDDAAIEAWLMSYA